MTMSRVKSGNERTDPIPGGTGNNAKYAAQTKLCGVCSCDGSKNNSWGSRDENRRQTSTVFCMNSTPCSV